MKLETVVVPYPKLHKRRYFGIGLTLHLRNADDRESRGIELLGAFWRWEFAVFLSWKM